MLRTPIGKFGFLDDPLPFLLCVFVRGLDHDPGVEFFDRHLKGVLEFDMTNDNVPDGQKVLKTESILCSVAEINVETQRSEKNEPL